MLEKISEVARKLTGGRFTEKLAPPRAPCDFAHAELDSALLLNRPAKRIDQKATRKLLAGKRILITGAGGTIGSEIVRQAVTFDPSAIALVDNSEFNLYQMELELSERGGAPKRVSHLADVCRRPHLDRVFSEFRPDIVLHAAAYKHLPMVEENPCAGALTNILGAKNVFDAATQYGAETVVFISTDKAVNPSSFMGATKRVAELFAQALDVAQTDTRFVTVRFGNVLGSTGSVVPLFQRQIAHGGPVTVTHPDISRYFMTTREAVQLVLQAASLDAGEKGVVSHDGRIFVLDMGEPVKILDLAKRMIKIAGYTAGRDIEIAFTGLRPGEKLFEEIFLDTEKLVKTGADGVLLAAPTMIDLPLLNPRLEDVIEFALNGDEKELLSAISHLVPEFSGGVRADSHRAASNS
ncbi:MAG: hypothetical protein Tsb0010_16480 [Parvularculaceae bacterium]